MLFLQIQNIDSFRRIILDSVRVAQQKQFDAVEYINNMNSFYNSAWDKLIIVGSIAFGVVGIIVPLMIQWYQKKNTKLNEELLKNEIQIFVDKATLQIRSEISKSLEDSLKEHEEKGKKMEAFIRATTFHLQGNNRVEKGEISLGLSDYITAADGYLICEDYLNLQRVLKGLLIQCLPKLSVEEINDIKIKNGNDFEELLTDLEIKDDNGAFTDILGELKFKFSKLPKTIREKEAENNKNLPPKNA